MGWELAGIVGVHAGQFTLRQLWLMAKRRQTHEWDQTAQVLALMANCNRDPKKRAEPFRPEEFHPYADRSQSAAIATEGKNLKAWFPPAKAKKT